MFCLRMQEKRREGGREEGGANLLSPLVIVLREDLEQLFVKLLLLTLCDRAQFVIERHDRRVERL